MKKRCIVSLTCALMMAFAFSGVSCAKETVPENTQLTKEEASESPAAVEAQDPSGVIAGRVNGREITMESVIKEMNKKVSMQRSENTPTEEETGQMMKDSLDTLIFLELAAEHGEKNIKVSDDEVEENVKKLKENLKTDHVYDNYLKSSKLTDETLREEIKKRLIIQKVFQQEVDSKAVLDEEEARREYDAQQKSFTIPERIEVDYISVIDGEDGDSAKKRAEDIAAELKEVKSAEEIKDKTGIRVNTVTISEAESPEFFKMVSALEPSDVSEVFEEKESYHVMLVRKKIPEELIPFEKAKKWFEKREKKKRAMEWFQELKKDAKIEVMLDTPENKSGNEGMGEKGEQD